MMPLTILRLTGIPISGTRAVGGISMKRSILGVALTLVVLVGLQLQPARAQTNNWNAGWNGNWNAFWTWFAHGQDPRLAGVGIGVGAATAVTSYFLTEKHGNPGVRHMTAWGAYGVTTLGCVAVYPMVATVVLNRPLTPREAYIGMADCVVPFLGGMWVDAVLPHTAWYDGTPAKRARVH